MIVIPMHDCHSERSEESILRDRWGLGFGLSCVKSRVTQCRFLTAFGMTGSYSSRNTPYVSRFTHFAVHFSAQASNNPRQRPDVLERCAEVGDAGAQQELAIYHRIRHEYFSPGLQPVQQFGVEPVQVLLYIFRACLEVFGHVAESGNAQALRGCLQFRVLTRQAM